MTASRGFVGWLMSQQVSLAFSTYQTGKLFLVGHNDDGRFSVYDRTFERAMGLTGFKTDEIRTRVWADPDGLRELGR